MYGDKEPDTKSERDVPPQGRYVKPEVRLAPKREVKQEPSSPDI